MRIFSNIISGTRCGHVGQILARAVFKQKDTFDILSHVADIPLTLGK